MLGVLFVVWWIGWAIAPLHPDDWWLENILVGIGLPLLFITARWFVFSRTSYFLAFFFLCLHTLGAHYTYSEVPMDAWFKSVTGTSTEEVFGWERNQFDRIIHFLYGFLITWPYRELYFHLVVPRNVVLGYLAPVSFVLATSAIYELIEWAAAEVFGNELGAAFLGTQGDVWDAHKDIYMAMVGSLCCLAIVLGIRLRTGRDLQEEWGTGGVIRRP